MRRKFNLAMVYVISMATIATIAIISLFVGLYWELARMPLGGEWFFLLGITLGITVWFIRYLIDD